MGTATRPGGASAGDREAAKPGGAEAAAAAVGAGTTANRTGTTSDRAGTASGTTDAAASRTDASTGRTGTAASGDGGTAGSTDTAPSSGDAARRTGTPPEPADAAARTGTASEPAGAGTGRTGTATGTAGKASRGDAGGAAAATPAAGTDKAAEKGGVGGPVSVERLPTRLDLNKARHAAAAQNTLFRLGDLVHSDARPRPDGGQMLGVCAWATALVLAGIGVAIRGLLAIVGGVAPAWYQPALVGTGLIGLALTVAAFVTIQRRHIPWFLLALATIPLAAAIALTIIAL